MGGEIPVRELFHDTLIIVAIAVRSKRTGMYYE